MYIIRKKYDSIPCIAYRANENDHANNIEGAFKSLHRFVTILSDDRTTYEFLESLNKRTSSDRTASLMSHQFINRVVRNSKKYILANIADGHQ